VDVLSRWGGTTLHCVFTFVRLICYSCVYAYIDGDHASDLGYGILQILQKPCPKDNFSLPNTVNLVDAIGRHEMLSLMDGFYGKNQIKVATKDQHLQHHGEPFVTT